MRALLVLLILAAAGAAALLLLNRGPRGSGPEPAGTVSRTEAPAAPVKTAAPDGGDTAGSTHEAALAAPRSAAEGDPAVTPETAAGDDPNAFPTGRMASFHGAALLQREGSPPVGAGSGWIELAVLMGRHQREVTAVVSGGRFDAEIPEIARVLVLSASFDGVAVRFPGLDRPFDPTDDDYALVGIPIPVNVLVPLDAATGTPLAGITVRRGDDATAARLREPSPPAADPSAPAVRPAPAIVEDAASPITLPWIESTHPVWLHLSKDGYASGSVLVDPNREARREVRLWPSASLTVRLTGPGRERADAVVLLREEGEGRTVHAATFQASGPGVQRSSDAIELIVEGLAARPHQIAVKGHDGRFQVVDLATARIDLDAGADERITLLLERP